MFDLEAVHSRLDLVARLHLRVLRGQRVEKRAVAAAEVADADYAFRVGDDFEMTARKKFVGHAHMTFAADDESRRRHFELLAVERTFDADENDAASFRAIEPGRAHRLENVAFGGACERRLFG